MNSPLGQAGYGSGRPDRRRRDGRELDVGASLAARVELLAGLPMAEVERVRDDLVLTPGRPDAGADLEPAGLCGGRGVRRVTVLTDRFVAELGLDFAAANELEVMDGRFTGRVIGEVGGPGRQGSGAGPVRGRA